METPNTRAIARATGLTGKTFEARREDAFRRALRLRFGARNYRITRDGDIHAYGIMPNTGQLGWYLFGDVSSPDTAEGLGVDYF